MASGKPRSREFLGLNDDDLLGLPYRQRWPYFRWRIWQRDNGLCGFCGHPVPLTELHIDHIKPRAVGGATHWDNLRPAHRHCNTSNGKRSVDDYRIRNPTEKLAQPVVFHLVAPESMVADLDAYFHEQRYRSRSAAMKALLAYGLRHRPTKQETEALMHERYGAQVAD